MSYTPIEWKIGDVITAEKLNNMEDGIVSLDTIFPVTVNAEMDVVNGNAITVKDFDYAYSEVTGLIESGKRPMFFVNLDLVASGSVVAKQYLLFSNVIYDYSTPNQNKIVASYFQIERDSVSGPFIMPCYSLTFNSSGMTMVSYTPSVNA